MKVSIVTTSYNSIATLADTLHSVATQTHPSIEHIVVDGASTDGSRELIESWGQTHSIVWSSEKDKGIYDALNKGISMSTGDIIALLHSDDFYASREIVSDMVKTFESMPVDAVYGDIDYVDFLNTEQITRHYSSKKFSPSLLPYGWIPAHPSLFLRKSVYERFGLFDSSFKIAGDFEFLSRIFWNTNLKSHYRPTTIVRMREGGASNQNLKSRWRTNMEILKACKKNGIPTNLLKLSLRYPLKLLEYVKFKRVA